ncbi:hypothetical protein BSKO_02291 [Bryopsis sp. KO-2023]|nr:hypothetical protein BSKO_02291 [Bryopsis sp. KO-2023]
MDTGEDAMEEDEEKPQEAPKSTSIFSRFAEQFFPPMLDAITDDLTSEGSSSTKGTFHYLLRDLCLVWLRWGALFERASSGALKYESEIGGAGRKLMRHLLLVGFSSNADVLRVNFEYIRAFVGQWGACVPLPIDALLMHIQPSKDTKKPSGVIQKQMIFGLKLMAVALKYGQGEGMIGGPQSEGLWKGLLSVFQFSRPGSRLCRQAGETTGLFVRAISKHSAPPIQLAIEKVEMEVKDGIRTLFGKFLHGSLLVYLDGMSEFYPSIVDASKTWIINVLLKVDGKQRTTALEILRRRARQLPDLFFDITREDFLGSMLVSKFPEVQFSILGLVRDLLPLQAQEPAAKVVGLIVHAFVNHANEKWRIGLFELLRDAWQLWPDADVRDKHLKGPLVALLSDENQEVYRELVKFWHSILPQTHPERLQALLALSIDPGSPWTEKIQRRWPQVASALLLELPKSTPTYEKAVFETSLAECKFMDYSVNTWQGPNTATMFSMGTTSYSQDPYSLAAFGGSPSKMGQGFQGKTTMSPNRVRATMASTLTPTIALSLPVESSMGQSAHQEKASNSPPREQRAHLRRRVYKSSGVEAGIAATLRRGATERKRQEERRSRVQLYRTYRAGELPDIQGIKVSGFVAPLAQIAVRDTTTACALVAAITKTVFDEIQQSQGNVRILESIHQQVDRCLSSKSRHSGYVQCLAGIVVAGRGIWISPESLVSSARSSGEYQAMAFVLEKQMVDPPLIAALESKKPSSRRPGTVRTYPVAPPLKTDGDAWMCLAELFREMGKGDLLHVIRMGHLTKCPGSRRALMALQSGRAAVALDLCEKLLEAYDEGMVDLEDSLIGGQEVSPAEANIWYDDKMECLEKLGCWRVLQDQIGLELDETGEVLEQNIGRLVSSKEEDKHLGRYLRPFVRSCLFQRTEQNTLALLLDPIKTNREKMGVVHATIPAELACIHAVRSEWTAASADLRASLKSFCMQWSGTNVGSSDARHSLLSLLQPMSEAQEVVETVLASRREDGSILVLGGDVEKCVRQWLIRWPNASYGQEEQALAIVSFRELLLRAIQPIASLNGKNSSTFLFIRKLLQELKLHAASCYQSQGMLDLAQELLEECRLEFIGKQNIDVLPYLVTKVEVCVAKIKQPLEHEAALYSTLNRDLEELAGYKNSMERSVEFQLRAAVVQGEGYWLAAHQPGASGSDRSLKSSNSFKKWMEAVQSSHSEHVEGVAKAALGFALLCNELIEESEETASINVTFQGMSEEVKGKIDSWGGLSATMVSTLLHSMALGCSDASLYVPRILTAMIHDVMSREEFAKGWRGVPLSAFLPWVSQMMGQLEEDMGSFLVPCLDGLAEEYPQHLYFPFHLCQANLQSVGKSRMRSFEEKLNIPVLKDFADALHKLTYPVQRWEGYEALIVRALQSGDKNEASRIFRDEAIPDLFSCDSGQTGGLGRNNINAKFSKAYKAAFTSAFGMDGRRIASMNSDAFRKKSRQIVTKAKDDLSKQQGKCELSLFTPWFSDFTTSYSSEASGGTKLFLPRMASVGGGGGFHDVAVVGFGKTVDIFSSKQKPKKLTIYAEDFTAYEFVVKGGEELRIDQRVEQLFGVMNGLAARNPAAASRNLKMRTYDVIPLSPTLGLLAFVDGTRPLESVMVPGTIPQSEYKKSAEVFQSFITKGMGGYENVFKKSNREYVISHFENAESFVPWDGLREALVRYSGSPEGFIRFREVFLRSLSVSCVMGYIAGVGDRHLQNFLVEETSGTLIPIDFGYSFGTATQVLPIPELMPFRLTRQLIGVSAPHDGKAILAMYMKEIMVALRQGRQVIEGIMEAFLREPLLDWQREAQVLSKIKGKKVAQGDVEHREEMHAQLKVEHSKQKLRGKHPVDIMLSELAGRHGGKPYWRTLEAVVRGDPNTNRRAQVKCKGGGVLSCEEQVECLLDQATDGNILGRTWWGWRPWI